MYYQKEERCRAERVIEWGRCQIANIRPGGVQRECTIDCAGPLLLWMIIHNHGVPLAPTALGPPSAAVETRRVSPRTLRLRAFRREGESEAGSVFALRGGGGGEHCCELAPATIPPPCARPQPSPCNAAPQPHSCSRLPTRRCALRCERSPCATPCGCSHLVPRSGAATHPLLLQSLPVCVGEGTSDAEQRLRICNCHGASGLTVRFGEAGCCWLVWFWRLEVEMR